MTFKDTKLSLEEACSDEALRPCCRNVDLLWWRRA